MATTSGDGDGNGGDALTDEQLDLLWRAGRDYEDPVLVERRAIEAAESLLGAGLRERGITDPSSLSFEALVAQFSDLVADADTVDDDGSGIGAGVLDALGQHPETGGDDTAPGVGSEADAEAMVDPSTGRVDAESLSADTFRDIKADVRIIDTMADRTPEHVDRKRREVADRLGCEPDEVPTVADLADAY